MLEDRGLQVERQKSVAFEFQGMRFEEGLRVDLLVENLLVVELKSAETLASVHGKQLLTYLRLLDLRVGLLINFGASTFKQGVIRVVNHHRDFASSREPVVWPTTNRGRTLPSLASAKEIRLLAVLLHKRVANAWRFL